MNLLFFQKLKNSHLIVIFVLLLGSTLIFESIFSNKKASQENNKLDQTSVDTLIPENMTLVPIEIENLDSLKEIVGNFGLVDLYSTSNSSSKSQRIASSIKIMRAPLNPDIFAVLVEDHIASQIAGYSGPFFVTVLNPKSMEGKKTQDPSLRTLYKKTQIIMEMPEEEEEDTKETTL